MYKLLATLLMAMMTLAANAIQRQIINFNDHWLLQVGDMAHAEDPGYDDHTWQQVTLPHAFNGHEAFGKDIVEHTDTIVWYRKHFTFDNPTGKKVYVEFEGVRQAADFYLNGRHLGMSENGVMACGLDLTPYLKEGENVLAVRCDNNWAYQSREKDCRFQWNNRNFNANYGGIPKNVFLHVADLLHQTLPLYSNLGTTGTYVYATDFDIAGRSAVIHAESEVRNDDAHERSFTFVARVVDNEGREVAVIDGPRTTIPAGATRTVSTARRVEGLHFWSWGYGYLYTVHTSLKADDGTPIDDVVTRTGFRKTRFGEGKIWLNDRVMMVHGYAQRTSNEWPGTGLSVPAWLSDYSNRLMVESGANMVRWMHVTPWKQDVESCDRVGLPQAMPAGDAEKDIEGPQWTQRVELMRDAIIYNRNNPSILFYEGGNESISREHMMELKGIRDRYDPHGGRAIGSREMLDIDEAEYGGEMLYINKSGKHPMWAMEYCRDEGLRKYWDSQSYPFHQEGDGPLYRGKPATDYNHNMDAFAVEMVRRWHEYWVNRPGTGRRVSSGGVKIVFSDTNTHHRGESNYRTSGVVDAMRIPKDAFFAHQVMWTGWVDDEQPRTYIVGHWNYDEGVVKDVLVVSNAQQVQLLLNGKPLGTGKQSYRYLHTFEKVSFEAGTLEAIGDNGSRYTLTTAGKPHHLHLTVVQNPEGMKADGADMALIEAEVVDKDGHRCPLDNSMVHFTLTGEGRWIGGIATRDNKALQQPDTHRDPSLLDAAATRNLSDNYVGSLTLPVECGVNRVLVQSTTNAGDIVLYANIVGQQRVEKLTLTTQAVDSRHFLPQLSLPCNLTRGETPSTPSYTDSRVTVDIREAKVATAETDNDPRHSFDDNELSEWRSDGQPDHAWITYTLAERAPIDEISLKLTGWRNKCYPLAIYAHTGKGQVKIWEGITPATLGYVHLHIDKPVNASQYTIKMIAPAQDSDKFGDSKELAGGNAGELDRVKAQKGRVDLRIVEADFMRSIAR